MSDLVTIAVIGAFQALGLAWLNRKTGEKVAKVHDAIAETQRAMVTLEQNTNSIKDALVETTARESEAKGNLKGRAEAKAESRQT